MNRRDPASEWTTEPFTGLNGPGWTLTPFGTELRDLPPSRVREHRRTDAGGDEFRVRLLAPGEAVPSLASAVPDETPLHDWRE